MTKNNIEVYAGSCFDLKGDYADLTFSQQGQDFIHNILTQYGLDPEDVKIKVKVQLTNLEKLEERMSVGHELVQKSLSESSLIGIIYENTEECENATKLIDLLHKEVLEDEDLVEEIQGFYRYSDALRFFKGCYGYKYDDDILHEVLVRIRYKAQSPQG